LGRIDERPVNGYQLAKFDMPRGENAGGLLLQLAEYMQELLYATFVHGVEKGGTLNAASGGYQMPGVIILLKILQEFPAGGEFVQMVIDQDIEDVVGRHSQWFV